jgi:hypothetical protein
MLLPGCATRLAGTLPDIRERLTSVHAGSAAAYWHLPIGSLLHTTIFRVVAADRGIVARPRIRTKMEPRP